MFVRMKNGGREDWTRRMSSWKRELKNVNVSRSWSGSKRKNVYAGKQSKIAIDCPFHNLQLATAWLHWKRLQAQGCR